MTIRAKFATGLAFILVINLAAGLYAFSLYQQATSQAAEVREASSEIVATALSTQVRFKKQVQEWKNILLRGQEPELFNKYLAQFEHEEESTRDSMRDLIKLLGENQEARETAGQFLEAHNRLGEEYRAALGQHRFSDLNTARLVDQQVRGIDRRPTDLLDEVVNAALAHKDLTLNEIAVSTERVEHRIFFIMVSIMTGAVMLLILLVDRTIGQPIATATAIARRVSAGDFSTPIHVTGEDENAQMLSALKTMQENLAESRESLRQSEAHAHMLLESTGEGIFGVDTQGRCIFCNPAAAQFLGHKTTAALEGRKMHDIMHHHHPDGTPYPAADCQASNIFRDGSPVHVDDEVFWRADGSSFPVEYHANPILRDGALVGAVVNFSDVSERRQAEVALRNAHDALAKERSLLTERVRERTAELDRANAELGRTARAKDEFLAAMSHELRTPLTSILGLSETMGDGLLGTLSPQQAKAAFSIHENGAHLLELINDILDMSRVASGRMTLRRDQVPVNQLWDACLRLIRPPATAKGLHLETHLDPAVQLVHGDSRRLKQMLINLLGNAVKFTPEGGTIGLNVLGEADQRQVRIRVWDTGIGIPADQLERLFKPFVQVDNRLSRQHGGTGLGLALAYGMAQLHGGTIEVGSEVGKGSHFDLILPWNPQAQKAVEVPEEGRVSEEASPPAQSLLPARVLLAEDNADNLEMISHYLQLRGFEVHAARNGLEAVVVARACLPDIIVMDVQMPELDGLEATRQLRADPKLRRTPIIALTALAMPGDRERCLDAGMDDYLSKPLGLSELHKSLTSWIKRTRGS
ncbi:MAG: ATP-binding protein [Chromatiaceae bacterium]